MMETDHVYYLPTKNKISIVPENVHEIFQAYVSEQAEKRQVVKENLFTDIIYLGVL